MPRRKRVGRPPRAGKTADRWIRIRVTAEEVRRIKAYLRRENAEVAADPHADETDRRPATVSSWIRDMIDEAIGGVS